MKAGDRKKLPVFLCPQRYKDTKQLICRLSLQSKMKSNTYIPQRYKSVSDGLKSACLDYVTKTWCKCSTMLNKVLQYKKVLQYNIVKVCKFAIRPKNCIGLNTVERLRVQYDRTVTSKGCNKSNGLGFQATERPRVKTSRTININ